MDDFDASLKSRLERLEGTLPGGRVTPRSRRPLRLSLGMVSGIAAVALLAGAAGATVISESVRGRPGLFAPGGPFHCSRIQQMNPREAETVLSQLGYDVTWQVEDIDQRTYELTSVAPDDGYIIEGVLDRSTLLLVVERGAGAVPAQPSC